MSLFNRKKKPEALTRDLEPHSTDVTYTLTEAGKEKAESIMVKGDKLYILQTILERGNTANIREIADETGFNNRKVLNLMQYLNKTKYVKEVKT